MIDSRKVVEVGLHLLKRCIINSSFRTFWSQICKADRSLYAVPYVHVQIEVPITYTYDMQWHTDWPFRERG